MRDLGELNTQVWRLARFRG